MMGNPGAAADLSFIWANLRNSVPVDSLEIPGDLKIVGAAPGEFPVSSYRPIFLEAPRDSEKYHTVGRRHYPFGKGAGKARWNRARILTLPIYESTPTANLTAFKAMVKSWGNSFILDDIPCAAIAVKIRGHHTEDREGQCVSVLALWSDGVGRLFDLEWAEGPLEDCITPEWRISSTGLLPLSKSLDRLSASCDRARSWKGTSFSILAKPRCLCQGVSGSEHVDATGIWRHEWEYAERGDMAKDLASILENVKGVFSA